MRKIKDAQYCKYKASKQRHTVMKKYHENNWKYNMLRWNKKIRKKGL